MLDMNQNEWDEYKGEAESKDEDRKSEKSLGAGLSFNRGCILGNPLNVEILCTSYQKLNWQ